MIYEAYWHWYNLIHLFLIAPEIEFYIAIINFDD